jgi:hypothetical protein
LAVYTKEGRADNLLYSITRSKPSIMKALPLLLFAFIHYTCPFAQSKTSVTIKAGSSIMDVLSTAEIFQYSQFTYGKVYFKDGTNAEAKMNYNRLLDEIHFIDAKGDTLALANEKTIKYIAIGEDSFYYEQSYLRRISGNNIAKLAVNQVWKFSDKRKGSAYNITSSISSISSRSSYYDGRRFHAISIKEDVVLSMVEQYYFGDKFNHFVKAGKKGLMMLFPREERRINGYLKDNKVDFDNKEDLEKIIQFLAQS